MGNDASTLHMAPPPVETLRSLRRGSPWPETTLRNPSIREQALSRERLAEALIRAFSLPETSGSTDTPAAFVPLYEELTELLVRDPESRRLLLYLPFEILARAEDPVSQRFRRAYVTRWKELLTEYDVRANFVDGDILETELAPNGQPRVHKATHLIPGLLARGILGEECVASIARGSGMHTLTDDIRAALAVRERATAPSDAHAYEGLVADVPRHVLDELRTLEMREALDLSRGMPQARVAWQRRDGIEKMIGRLASAVSRIDRPADALALIDSGSIAARIAIRSARLAIESLIGTDRASAARLARDLIVRLRHDSDPTLSDERETALCYLVSWGLIPKEEVRNLDVIIPDLAADFDPAGSFAHLVRDMNPAIEHLRSDPDCARLLYPVVLSFGSRLKGYATRDADLDIGVFVRPGIDTDERARIRAIIARTFADRQIGGKAVEFWLESVGGRLRVRDTGIDDVYVADETWAHLLFGSVWRGDRATIHDLHARLLTGFLEAGRMHEDEPLRRHILAQMERETLQYRLMHKGYRRFFPKQTSSVPAPLDDSVFWDPGYRRLASMLYARRVFLPVVG